LGVTYQNGQGVPQDNQQALAWFNKAAEQGHAPAQFNLGVMYQHGQGVPQDNQQAVAWYRKAAEQGNAEAQHNLGVMYANGQGISRDLVLAYALFNLSAAQGIDQAVKNRDRLLAQLSPRQVQEGQRLASEWRPGKPIPINSTTEKAR
jgi:TPR repeat protein